MHPEKLSSLKPALALTQGMHCTIRLYTIQLRAECSTMQAATDCKPLCLNTAKPLTFTPGLGHLRHTLQHMLVEVGLQTFLRTYRLAICQSTILKLDFIGHHL